MTNHYEPPDSGRAYVQAIRAMPDESLNPCLACSPPLLIDDVIVGINGLETSSYEKIVALGIFTYIYIYIYIYMFKIIL